MSDFERHGNGVNGRVDGPRFDARYILMPAAMVFGTLGEQLQTEAQQREAMGRPLIHMSGLIGRTFEAMATMPLDSKAVGLACGVAAATQLIQAGKSTRDIAIENSIIASGLPRESAVEPVHRRALKRLGSWAVAGAGAFGAYKVGEHLTPTTDLVTGMGFIGVGLHTSLV